MSDQNSSVGRWLAGIMATIISGVGIYFATEGRSAPSAQSSTATATVSSPLPNREKPEPKVEIRQPESSKLVGTWRARGVVLGQAYDVVWHARPDGTATYLLDTGDGPVRTDGTWQYSDGILYETSPNGSETGAVELIDSNQVIVTIIDNGTPAFSGVKVHYYRQ